MISLQLCVYGANIGFNNSPIINFTNKQELHNFITLLDTKYGILDTPHFVINKSHLLPYKLDFIHNTQYIYYDIRSNIHLLYNKINDISNNISNSDQHNERNFIDYITKLYNNNNSNNI
jgi:hypothetical protein